MENTKQTITDEIKELVMKKVYRDENGRKCITVGSCRLDFSNKYFFNGFTNKTLKLSWQNGDEEVKCQGKIYKRNGEYKLVTDGWNFIEKLNKVEE